MSAVQPPRKPWSTRWIVVAIILVIVPYTYLRWHYRKPGRAFEPYHDIKDRANTMRLLSAGFQRISLEAERPAEASRLAHSSTINPAPGGLPGSLDSSLVERPLLPAEIGSVSAAPGTNAMFSYPIEFSCTLADNHQQLSGANLYLRSREIFILPDFERLSGNLLARNRDNFVRLTIPAGALKPGHYLVTLVGSHSSKAWSLEVK